MSKGDEFMGIEWEMLEDAFGFAVHIPYGQRMGVTEIRIGANRPVRVRMGLRECFWGVDGALCEECNSAIRVDAAELRRGLERMVHYSLYAYEEQLAQGFLTVEGGHRIGVCGRGVMENGRVKTLTDISSMIIRIAHEVKGCSDRIFPYLLRNGTICHTMIVSPPGAGKTTLLRDLLRKCSDELSLQVGIADERSELAACHLGVPQMDVGLRTEVLDGIPKAKGIRMLLRSAAPQVIGADEIGSRAEAEALAELMRCGVRILYTVHAGSIEEVRERRELSWLFPERIVVLEKLGEVAGVWNQEGKKIDVDVEVHRGRTFGVGRMDGGRLGGGTF